MIDFKSILKQLKSINKSENPNEIIIFGTSNISFKISENKDNVKIQMFNSFSLIDTIFMNYEEIYYWCNYKIAVRSQNDILRVFETISNIKKRGIEYKYISPKGFFDFPFIEFYYKKIKILTLCREDEYNNFNYIIEYYVFASDKLLKPIGFLSDILYEKKDVIDDCIRILKETAHKHHLYYNDNENSIVGNGYYWITLDNQKPKYNVQFNHIKITNIPIGVIDGIELDNTIRYLEHNAKCYSVYESYKYSFKDRMTFDNFILKIDNKEILYDSKTMAYFIGDEKYETVQILYKKLEDMMQSSDAFLKMVKSTNETVGKNSNMLKNNETYFETVDKILDKPKEPIIKPLAFNNGVETIYIEDENGKRIKKILHIPKLNGDGGMKEWSLFERSIETLKNLNINRIPKVLSSGKTDSEIWFEYQYIEGISLADIIKNKKSVDIEDIIKQLLFIQKDLIASNIIHRDIKPSNVIINDKGEVYLIDLNTAKSNTSNGTTSILSWGYTPIRELLLSNNKTDIYSIGIIFYEMLTFDNVVDLAMKNKQLELNKISSIRYRNIIKGMTEEDFNLRWDISKIMLNFNSNISNEDIRTWEFARYSVMIGMLLGTVAISYFYFDFSLITSLLTLTCNMGIFGLFSTHVDKKIQQLSDTNQISNSEVTSGDINVKSNVIDMMSTNDLLSKIRSNMSPLQSVNNYNTSPIQWLIEHGIEYSDITVEKDGVIINDDCNLDSENINEFPFYIKEVNGDMDISDNPLTYFLLPEVINGDFTYSSHTKLDFSKNREINGDVKVVKSKVKS